MRFFGLVCLALIPLQWFVIAGNPVGGNIRVHQLGVLVLAVGVFITYGLKYSADIVYRFRVFLVANAYMYIIWAAVTLYGGTVPIEPVLEIIYMGFFLAIGTYFYVAALSPDIRFVEVLRWTGPATLVVLLAGLTAGAIQNGVNMFAVVAASIAAVDPNIIEFGLFRRVFGGFGYGEEDVRANFRHEIFGGLLFSMYVTGWAHSRVPFQAGLQSWIYRVTMVGGTVMLLISLSRSIIVAAAIWPLLLVARALATGRVSQRNQLTGIAVLIGAVIAGIVGVWELLWERFFERTDSYETRANSTGLAFETIEDHFWFGQPTLTGQTSAHNFVLDAWSSAGVFVGIPAVVVFVTVYALWISMLLRFRTLSDEMLTIAAALALPSIRLVTQGGGLLAMVEWVTLGFIAGVLAAVYRSEYAVPSAERAKMAAAAAARAAVVQRGRSEVRSSSSPAAAVAARRPRQ